MSARPLDADHAAATPRTTARDWWSATRPRTLASAIMPVLVAVALAHAAGHVVVWRSVAVAVVSLAIQIGTNLANDYGDGVRGADEGRVGPVRLVATKRASPQAVRNAAFASFLLAAILGVVLAAATSWWLLAAGAASIAAGWFYTAGPLPYGYRGLGEIFVFVFFGEVAVLGSTYVASGTLPAATALHALPVGLLTTSLLVVNNLRDIETDARHGKRTLAVVLGDRRTRRVYESLVVIALMSTGAASVFRHFAFLGACALLFAIAPLRRVHRGATGRELVLALIETGRLQMAFGLLFAIGLAL